MIGRRVATVEEITEPGDYSGPHAGYSGPGKSAVFFLLPVEPDDDRIPEWGHSLHLVASPPHVFRECPDGSVEIRESIGAGAGQGPDGGFYWHGYLDEGHSWREC